MKEKGEKKTTFGVPVSSGQSEVRLAEALGNGFVWIPSSTQLLRACVIVRAREVEFGGQWWFPFGDSRPGAGSQMMERFGWCLVRALLFDITITVTLSTAIPSSRHILFQTPFSTVVYHDSLCLSAILQ